VVNQRVRATGILTGALSGLFRVSGEIDLAPAIEATPPGPDRLSKVFKSAQGVYFNKDLFPFTLRTPEVCIEP
jgi:hypothetical protein